MSLITMLGRSTSILRSSLHTSEPYLKVSERKISDISKKITPIDSMSKKKIMSFEEYSKEHHGSLEDFIQRMKPAFPNSSDERLKKAYEDSCKCGYRTYKRACENPGNNIGLMLQSDFFDEDCQK